jgi:hypothetical protein
VTQDPVIVDVTGGAGGVAASYDAALALAEVFDAAGDRLRGWGTAGLRTMRDPDLLESGLLSPGTCAAAEEAVMAAAAGPHGAIAASLGWEADAVAVRCAIAFLEETDEVVRASVTAIDRRLAPAEVAGLATVVAVGGPDALTDHPGLLSHAVTALGGPTGAGALSLLYGDPGRPVVAPYDVVVPGSGVQPRSVRELLEHLHQVAALSGSPDSPANGTIEVQTITGPDGQVRHIVYLPGTDEFEPPWDQDADVRDLQTNLQLVGGQPDAYQQGILQALEDAGVRPGQPVLLVGHSQGGMEAAAILAGDDGGLDVTDVVTAGAPTAQLPGFPTGAHVISLEQVGDVVPQLEGAPNADSVEQTTITFDAHPDDGVLAHHGYEVYEDGAGLADSSTDPSVAEAVQSLHSHGFLGDGGHATAQVFQITRAP